MHAHEPYPLQEFLDYLSFQKRYSPHTLLSYENDLNNFFDFLRIEFETTEIKDISSVMVRSWLADLKEKKFTSRTINRKISTLKSFFKFHLRLKTISTSPVATSSSLKISRKLPAYVEQEDMKKIFLEGDFTSSWEGIVALVIITIFYQTGIRLSELIHLKESDIDKSSSIIKVLGKGNKERIIPVNNQLIAEIDHYLSEKRKLFPQITGDFLLVNNKGKCLYPKYVYNIVKKNISKVSTIERKSPHILRHSFATHLTNNGAPINAIKELLGHSSLAATQMYTHNSIEKLKEVYKQTHPKA